MSHNSSTNGAGNSIFYGNSAMRRNTPKSVCRVAIFVGSLAVLVSVAGVPGFAQQAAETAPEDATNLADVQAGVADRYQRLEQVALRLAELTASTNPRRAELLRDMVRRSKEMDVQQRFEAIVALLEEDRLALALRDQNELGGQLELLLELLLKESRTDRIESEKQRVGRFLKSINRLIRQQRGVQSRTEAEELHRRLAELQRQVGEQAAELARQMLPDRPQPPDASPDAKPPESPPSEPSNDAQDASLPEDGQHRQDPSRRAPGQRSGGERAQEAPGDDRPDSKPGDAMPNGPPQDSSDGPRSSGSTPSSPSPAAKKDNIDAAGRDVQRARQRMRKAEHNLQQQQRSAAQEQQREALNALHEAKAQLERVLRQLREEELEEVLEQLESRFRKMLAWQKEVFDGTVKLDKTPSAERGHDEEIVAGRLSRREALIVRETDRVIAVMQADGTSVALPHAVELLREDMTQVTDRLARVEVGPVTQGLETDIIHGLEEIIQALDKSRKDLQQAQNARMSGLPLGKSLDPKLVDLLSEVKMIRTLQMRINNRTKLYRELLDDVESQPPTNLQQALQRLAEQEQRVREATEQLKLGARR